MIPDKQNTLEVKSFNVGRSETVEIDNNALAHIMHILTNLYSDTELAVIREYSTNARDSHVSAGFANKPIKVTLPTLYDNNFIVQDFGIGLSEDEIYNIYKKYGTSLKRESNEFNGMLGFGSKSGWTYTHQFTITSIKDGIKTTYSAHLNEEGIGTITKVFQASTDENNGVTIKIPVKNHYSFKNKALHFYKYWDVKPEITNEDVYFSELPELMFQSGNVHVHKGYEQSVLIMGNVAYPITDDALSKLDLLKSSGAYMIVYAPIGSVNFTPSREALHYTEKTYNYLQSAVKKLKEDYNNFFADKFKHFSNYAQAFDFTNDFKTLNSFIFNRTTYSYVKFENIDIHSHISLKGKVHEYSVYNNELQKNKLYNIYSFGKIHYFIHNSEVFTAKRKRQMIKYMEENQIQKVIGFESDLPNHTNELYFKGIPQLTFDMLDKIVVPKVESAGNKHQKMQYPYKTVSRYSIVETEFTDEETPIYIQQKLVFGKKNIVANLMETFNVKIYVVYSVDIPKFIKNHPTCISFLDWLKDIVKNSQFTEIQKLYYIHDSYRLDLLSCDLETEILDVILDQGFSIHKATCDIIKNKYGDDTTKSFQKLMANASAFLPISKLLASLNINITEISSDFNKQTVSYEEKYPLVLNVSRYHNIPKDHIIEYMNFVYTKKEQVND